MSDPKLHKLIMKYGIEGYGLYFACVELIAGNLSSENVTFELEHDAELLAHIFKMDSRRVEDIMKEAIRLRLFEYNSTTERIICLALAKRLDNTMSQNKEMQAILGSSRFRETLRNFKLLKADKIRLDKIRLDKNKKDTMSGKPDVVSSDFDVSCKAIILGLNALAGTHFKHSAKGTHRLIKARFSDGATLRDFEKVIKIKVEQWADDEKFKSFLRPETLFAANHFESYRNEYEVKYAKGE